MNARNDADRQLTAWLAASAPTREPEHLLGQVLARTARTRRRPAWRIPERWISMSTMTSRMVPASQVPWRALGAVALLALLVLAGAILLAGARPSTAPPYGLAKNGNLIYSSSGDIVVRSAVDSPATTIVAGAENDSDPILSRDGSRFAFLRHPDENTVQLWVANVDGSEPLRLNLPFQSLSWVDWSPQGEVMVVGSAQDPTAFTLVPANGGASTRVDVGIVAESPAFRPTAGTQISFRGRADNGDWGLYLVNRDGSGLVHLALDEGFRSDEFYAQNQPFYFGSPAWSPNGTRLAFHTLEPDPSSAAGPGFRVHVAEVSATGAVTSEQTFAWDPAADDELDATWLPGGDALLFQKVEGARHYVGYAELGGGAGSFRDLGVIGQDGIGLQVSPDGRLVVVQVPAAVGADPTISMIDLASGAISPANLAVDVAWQRLAR